MGSMAVELGKAVGAKVGRPENGLRPPGLRTWDLVQSLHNLLQSFVKPSLILETSWMLMHMTSVIASRRAAHERARAPCHVVLRGRGVDRCCPRLGSCKPPEDG